ncbi:cysteine--tRNA ligase [Candidatus Geothermarchaeota archaeon]|nr:MAG: cysteine--tRNA ligase [Candidatus Geothermarchaeota archaeon]
MTLKIYNTLTKRKEEFKPLRGNTVYIYWCGQTVYDSPHLGHARTYIVADMVRRWLKYRGYNVFYIENITDIDDKIIKRAKELGISYKEVAERYTKELEEVMEALGIHVEYRPRATEHILEMIELIKCLMKRGYAYELDDGVYFDTSKYKEYGKLSGMKLDRIAEMGHRIEPNPNKRNPADFSLWKKQKPGEPAWDSPWGKGRPGWHIECSAMSMKYLGVPFDIHGGGADLIFPHHENEIAQSEAATGRQFVRFWIHNGLLQIKGEKMAKSLKNFIPIRDALKKWDPEAIRLYLISTHYRKPLEFRETDLDKTSKNLAKFYALIDRLRATEKREGNLTPEEIELKRKISNLVKKFEKFMDDDFNSPGAISVLFEITGEVNKFLDEEGRINGKLAEEIEKTVRSLGWVFGILQRKGVEVKRELISQLIDLILDIRNELRSKKEYKLADRIRERLGKIGIIVEDLKDKSIWRIRT